MSISEESRKSNTKTWTKRQNKMKINTGFSGKIIFTACLLSIAILPMSCRENYSPRPYGYYRIDFPEKAYSPMTAPGLPYTFNISDQAVIEPDKSPDAEAYWINIRYPAYNAIINLSYKTIANDTSLLRYEQDCHRLAYAHTVKAESIKEQYFSRDKGLHGLLYLIEGNTASSTQFYITDSTRHFLRGSLYFHTHPNKDSLAPVIEYLRKDIVELMESAEFSR